MQEYIATGKTVEEAIENGLGHMGLTRDEVSVEVLEFPGRKLFKTIPARVKLSANAQAEAQPPLQQPSPMAAQPKKKQQPIRQEAVKPPVKAEGLHQEAQPQEEEIEVTEGSPEALACAYLRDIFAGMGVAKPQIKVYRQGDATLLRVEGDEIQAKLETKGEVIQAMSYLVDRAVNKGVDKKDPLYLRVRMDIAGYRNRREVELIALADRVSGEVLRTKRSVTLAPMNPYERLIIHTAIGKMEGLKSESKGEDVKRRVVIRSTAPDATEGDDWRPGKEQGGHGGNRRNDNNRRKGGAPTGRSGRPNREAGNRDRGPRNKSSVPEREYANKPRSAGDTPVIPERREAIKDGEDLPLYGKIEI